MDLSPRTPEERYGPALIKAQEELLQRDPFVIANWAGVRYEPGADGCGQFVVRFWGEALTVGYPGGAVLDALGQTPTVPVRLIALHYLLTATGAPMADRWSAFREFPGGMGYDAAFQARANRRLAAAFSEKLPLFREAGRAMGGIPLAVGDAAFAFDVFPRLRVAVVIYRGDEEFAGSANLIFDGAADRYLPTEDQAVLGDVVAGRLIKYQPK
jgi:hypothetical protein